MTKRNNAVLIPVVCVLLGFAVASVIILATGKNPGGMFLSMLQSITGVNAAAGSFNPRYIGEFIVQSMPIILSGLSVGFAFRVGLFNIGAEGQLMMGSLASIAVALFVKAPAPLHVILVLLAAMAAGAIWGAIPGYLKARFNVHEVVMTIMLNYVALNFCNWMIVSVFGSTDHIKTAMFPQSALLKDSALSALTNGSRLNWGFVPVILAVLVYWFIIERTTFGFSLRAVGFNKDAARCAGMKVERSVVMSMVLSGAFAGLAGAVLTVGTFSYGRVLSSAEGYGMDGIAVALVGANNAVGILLSGLLFGMLKAAQPLMQSQGIPKDIANIIQAAIVLFVAMKYGIDVLIKRIAPPKPEKIDEEARV
jgi:general nucleoside transport system permease protein